MWATSTIKIVQDQAYNLSMSEDLPCLPKRQTGKKLCCIAKSVQYLWLEFCLLMLCLLAAAVL